MTDRVAMLAQSPLAPGASPVRIGYRESGDERSDPGVPVVILHGGWGAAIYPFDRQVPLLARRHRVVMPDRTGYGRSGTLGEQPVDFHRRAAGETLALLDAIGIDRAIVWGHSDGAVIALWLSIAAPGRVVSVIAEAAHFFRRKPRSREFFET